MVYLGVQLRIPAYDRQNGHTAWYLAVMLDLFSDRTHGNPADDVSREESVDD